MGLFSMFSDMGRCMDVLDVLKRTYHVEVEAHGVLWKLISYIVRENKHSKYDNTIIVLGCYVYMGQLNGVKPVIKDHIHNWVELGKAYRTVNSNGFYDLLELASLGDKSNVIVSRDEIQALNKMRQEFLGHAFPHFL